MYTWSNDKDDELWRNGCFDTIQECISEAKEEGYKVGETIAVGETNDFKVYVDAERVLEMVQDDAYDECGEASDSWIDCRRHNLDELSDKLTDCVNEWLKETNQEPTFYYIDNIKRVEIK